MKNVLWIILIVTWYDGLIQKSPFRQKMNSQSLLIECA